MAKKQQVLTLTPFSPISNESLEEIGNSIVDELLFQQCIPFPPPRFAGAGIYAIFYRGPFPCYSLISQNNSATCEVPIYVGKATPEGGRKGISIKDLKDSFKLYLRLEEHMRSIEISNNLDIQDFSLKYLVVVDTLIELGERSLIQRFKPVWNACLDGFGNHHVGGGRKFGRTSGWDTLHPGRKWVTTMGLEPNLHTSTELEDIIYTYLDDFIKGIFKG